MAEYGTKLTCEAGAAILKYRFVKPTAVPTASALCKVEHCAAATDWPIGVSDEPQATVKGNIVISTPYAGIVEIMVGSGGVTILDNITSDGTGQAITAIAGDNFMARALSTALEGDLVVAYLYGSETSGLFTASSNLDDLVANSTTRTTIFVATSNIVITKAQIAFYEIPASTAGTVLGNLKTWDASGDVERNLLQTADLDLEGLTAKEGTALILQTTNPEYLQLDAGDTLYFESVSNNADMTGGTDGALTVEGTLD